MLPLYAPIASMNFVCEFEREYGFRAEHGSISNICLAGGSYRSRTRLANRFTSIRFNDSIVFTFIICFRATGVRCSKYCSSLKSRSLNTAVRNVEARTFISTYSRKLPARMHALVFFTSLSSSSVLCLASSNARSFLSRARNSSILRAAQTVQLQGKSSKSLILASPSSI